MKIHLYPEHEAFVREKVASGEYEAPDDVITAALDCFQQLEQFRALRLEQLDRGEGRPLDIEAIKAEGRRRLARRKKVVEQAE